MFNLNNLITSCMLATGVATTTPVNHADNLPTIKAENVINDYTLTLNENGQQEYSYYYTNVNNYNPYVNQNGNGKDKKINYYNDTTNYINVLGNLYTHNAYGLYNNEEVNYWQNKNTLIEDNYNEIVNNYMYVLQITPYNYNIDTEIEISVNFSIFNEEIQPDFTFIAQSRYFKKLVYHTTQENWASYINKQLVNNTPMAIKNDIEDVNNNFYYTKQENTIEFLTQHWVNDITTIGLEPKKTNYYVIMYTPIVDTYINDTINNEYYQDTQYEISPYTTRVEYLGTPTISGINVIPDGTYEVIDIPGLMWEILTMPFAFVSQAFNLTLFPGTPYQVNISNLFLSIIAVITFVWLITFFLKLKG